MFRLKIAAIIGGVVLAYFGVQEYRVSMGTSSEPLAVELAALESGETPGNNHILIGEHVADYAGCVYEYEEGSGRVTHMYYPIISDDNSFFTELAELYAKYDNPDDIPDEEYPGIHEFRVLVKTKRFKTENNIPTGLGAEDKVQGLIINLIDSMDAEEKRMIQSEFPRVNMDELLIVEDGRKPTSMFASLGMVGGGELLSFLGLAWMFAGRGSSSQPRRA